MMPEEEEETEEEEEEEGRRLHDEMSGGALDLLDHGKMGKPPRSRAESDVTLTSCFRLYPSIHGSLRQVSRPISGACPGTHQAHLRGDLL